MRSRVRAAISNSVVGAAAPSAEEDQPGDQEAAEARHFPAHGGDQAAHHAGGLDDAQQQPGLHQRGAQIRLERSQGGRQLPDVHGCRDDRGERGKPGCVRRCPSFRCCDERRQCRGLSLLEGDGDGIPQARWPRPEVSGGRQYLAADAEALAACGHVHRTVKGGGGVAAPPLRLGAAGKVGQHQAPHPRGRGHAAGALGWGV